MSQVRFDPQKYSRNAGNAAGDYAAGAANPRRPWATSAAAAKDNFAAGINTAIAEDRFTKGVNKAGDAKWNKGIAEKGRTRYQQGVSLASAEWSAGFQPFATALGSLNLGPRGPKGTNLDRVRLVNETMIATKKTQ